MIDQNTLIIIVVIVCLTCLSASAGALYVRQSGYSTQPPLFEPGKPFKPGTPFTNPATSWQVSVDNSSEIKVATPNIHFTDGYISSIKSRDNSRWLLFLSEADSFKGESNSPLFETVNGNWKLLMGSPPCRNLGPWPKLESYWNAGCWLMAVIRCPTDDNLLVGYTHMESRDCSTQQGQGGLPVTKSIGYTTSRDEGNTWTKPEQILWVSNEYTQGQAFKGCGDCCAIFNTAVNEWWLYFHSNNKVGLARSSHSQGIPGTYELWTKSGWRKPNNGQGKDLGHETLPGFPVGGNPSVYPCSFLQGYIGIICTWQNAIMICFSADGIKWESKPFPLQPHPRRPGGPWPYPCLVDPTGGTTIVGDKFMVYYSKTIGGGRGMYGKKVTLSR